MNDDEEKKTNHHHQVPLSPKPVQTCGLGQSDLYYMSRSLVVVVVFFLQQLIRQRHILNIW